MNQDQFVFTSKQEFLLENPEQSLRNHWIVARHTNTKLKLLHVMIRVNVIKGKVQMFWQQSFNSLCA